MKKRIRILGIAPYEGLRVLMEQAAEGRNDIEMVSVNGNLEEGAEIAKAMDTEYDVILSRANTADMIRNVTHLPVIDIGISYYDVLRCIKQAKETQTAFAITGFYVLTSIAKALCDLMEFDTEIFPVDTTNDTMKILSDIKRRGYQTIVCDTVPYPHAKLMGLTPILLTTGMDNVKAAIDNAVSQYKNQNKNVERMSMLQRVISSTRTFTLVMDCEKNVLFSANNLPNSEVIVDKIYLELKNDFSETTEFFINVKGSMYAVNCHYYGEAEPAYYVCHIKTTDIPITYTKYGIKIMNKLQAEEEFKASFYSTTGASRDIQSKLGGMNQYNGPVMICGETGTGKAKTACLLYLKSKFTGKPLFIINCALLNDRNWKFLVSNYNSPFMDNDNTIYISNVDALDSEKQNQLLSIMEDTNLHSRNRILMSCRCGYSQQIPNTAMSFINMLNCFVLNLTPMREQAADIRSSSILYLDILNQQLGKQVTGFQPEAMELLMNYSWPFNLVQFQRVLKEVIMRASSQYVTADIVEEVLRKEARFVVDRKVGPEAVPEENRKTVNIDQSLNLINREVIELVLKKYDGNQSAAAKHLGIGRTTMWRYLNQDKA